MPLEPNTTPCAIRHDLANTVEEIGQAMGLLRESADDLKNGNLQGSKLAASDALEIVASLEARFSDLAAKIARFSES